MKYEVGDKFTIMGVDGVVAHVNRGFAWLVPANEGDVFNGQRTMVGVAFAKIDGKGKDVNGVKAYPIRPKSGAV